MAFCRWYPKKVLLFIPAYAYILFGIVMGECLIEAMRRLEVAQLDYERHFLFWGAMSLLEKNWIPGGTWDKIWQTL